MKNKYYIYDALKILIETSKNAQEARQDLFRRISMGEWIREFCTIRAASARRCGHTTAISRLIKEDKMKLGVIFGHFSMKREFYEELVFSETISTFEQNLQGRRYNNDDIDGVIVDTSFLMSNKKRDIMMSFVGSILENRSKPFFLIFLQ